MFSLFRYLACGLVSIGATVALMGCQTFDPDLARVPRENGTGIPATAELVQQGRGVLSHRAETNGTIYLYSTNQAAILDRQRLRRGQQYMIEPNQNVTTLEGRTVRQLELNPKHLHRLYFDRDRR